MPAYLDLLKMYRVQQTPRERIMNIASLAGMTLDPVLEWGQTLEKQAASTECILSVSGIWFHTGQGEYWNLTTPTSSRPMVAQRMGGTGQVPVAIEEGAFTWQLKKRTYAIPLASVRDSHLHHAHNHRIGGGKWIRPDSKPEDSARWAVAWGSALTENVKLLGTFDEAPAHRHEAALTRPRLHEGIRWNEEKASLRAPHRPYEQGPFTRAKEATEEEVARCLQMDGGVCVELGIQYEDLVGFAIECAEVLITAYEKKGKGDRIASIVTGKGNATGAGKYMVSGKTLKSAGAKHVEKWLIAHKHAVGPGPRCRRRATNGTRLEGNVGSPPGHRHPVL